MKHARLQLRYRWGHLVTGDWVSKKKHLLFSMIAWNFKLADLLACPVTINTLSIACERDLKLSLHATVSYGPINPLTAKLFNLNFRSLEVVSRWRDPQLQVSENYSDLTKWRLTNYFQILPIDVFFLSVTCLKGGTNVTRATDVTLDQ